MRVTRRSAARTDSSMTWLFEDRVISAEEMVPSFSMRMRTVATNFWSCEKMEVGWSHWLKNRSWMSS